MADRRTDFQQRVMILVAILTIIIIMAPDCGTGRVLTTTMPPRWPHLTGAADYTNNQQVESKKFNFDYDGKCKPPYGSDYLNGRRLESLLVHWDGVNEIKFITGSENILQGNRPLWCKIKCVEGQWVGPLCTSDGENGRYQPLLKACHLRVPSENQVILSYHDHHKPLQADTDLMVPHSTMILARCPRLGAMKLLGVHSIQCRDGHWSHRLPTCLGTTATKSNSSDDYPPGIVIHVAEGAAGENAAGELIIRPGSIIHLDCLFNRRLGTPSWTWAGNDASRQYPSGWAMALQERNWHYRISIYHVQDKDEAEFTCATPKGHSNSISFVVRTVQCPAVPVIELPLKAVVEGVYAGQLIYFSCLEGYLLQGMDNATCLASGQWSSALPACQKIECPLELEGSDHRLEYEFSNNSYLGTARFSCPYGFRLLGPRVATCQKNMTWHPSAPTCQEIECPALLPPLNGRIIDTGRNFVGEMVLFSCNRHFQLVGQSQLTCTQDGSWSHPSPYCQLSCPNPGSPSRGTLTPVETHYEIGSKVFVSCSTGLQLQGRSWLVCQQDGTWTSAVGSCV